SHRTRPRTQLSVGATAGGSRAESRGRLDCKGSPHCRSRDAVQTWAKARAVNSHMGPLALRAARMSQLRKSSLTPSQTRSLLKLARLSGRHVSREASRLASLAANGSDSLPPSQIPNYLVLHDFCGC